MGVGVCQPPFSLFFAGLQNGIMIDSFRRFYNPNQEELIAPCFRFGIIAEAQVAKLPVIFNVGFFPTFYGYTLDSISEKLPDADDGEQCYHKDNAKDVPRKIDDKLAESINPVVRSFISPHDHQREKHPHSQGTQKIVNHLNQFLFFWITQIFYHELGRLSSPNFIFK
jgi:hypothetical protein